MKLVLIEAPGKYEAVSKYLGSEYKVFPTGGHVRDLPEKKLSVDIHNNFKPEYVVMPTKKKTVENLKKEAAKADEIYFATDPDREGEAIAWHLANILKINPKTNCRVTYNEISKKAVNDAIKNPKPIDENLVDAQQARRVLDRLVGYKLSPLLCKKIQGNLSAGRVQSVTLKLVVDRDREIENFVPQEYWNISAELSKQGKKEKFKAALALAKNKKIGSEAEVKQVLSDLEGAEYKIANIKRQTALSHAPAPFTTSTMQQEASSKLGLPLATTTKLAQSLYEGADVTGEGKVALITYIRTDSVRVSPDAQAAALEFIGKEYGKNYVPQKPNFYKSKGSAQDAHEAIRPISLERTPESLAGKMQPNALKLYKLIYQRFLASQMAEAKYDAVAIEIDAGKHKFKASGKTLVFDGFTKAYQTEKATDNEDDNTGENAKIPQLEVGEILDLNKLLHEQKFTKPPQRYTEGTLVKAMEDKGIGRPATYNQTVTTIANRKYIEKDGKSLISTDLGRKVVDMLVKFFGDIIDVKFTAEMETKLDTIEEGGKEWQKIIGDFYGPFENELKAAFDNDYIDKTPDEVTDIKCDKCGAFMVIKQGKYGKFLACPNYPTCKNTKQINEKAYACPKCGGDVIKKTTKSGKTFYGCSNYPKCDYSTWDTPTKYKCPNCGEMLLLHSFKGERSYHCIKCDFNKPEKKKTGDKKESNEQK